MVRPRGLHDAPAPLPCKPAHPAAPGRQPQPHAHLVLDAVVLVRQVCDCVAGAPARLRRHASQVHVVLGGVAADHGHQGGQRPRLADGCLVLHLDGQQAQDEADVALQLLHAAAGGGCGGGWPRWAGSGGGMSAHARRRRRRQLRCQQPCQQPLLVAGGQRNSRILCNMAADAEHRGSWTQHGAPCKESHRSCPRAERPLRAILPSHLMLGCSCASMSPPFSFFSRGTTTPTAPSAAASSRFSSAPSNAGGGAGFSAAPPGAACRRRCSTHSRLRRPCLGPASVMTRHCVLRAHSCARGRRRRRRRRRTHRSCTHPGAPGRRA